MFPQGSRAPLFAKGAEGEQLTMIEVPLSPPSHLDIVNYWKNRSEFERAFDNAPACFACTEGVHLWKRLERAHIVARSQGGSFWPHNFILLCHNCHLEQPMYVDREMVIQWAKNRPLWSEWLTKLIQQERDYYGPDFQFSQEDGRKAMIFLCLKQLRFHPQASIEQKFAASADAMREFVKLRDLHDQVFSQ
jgi:hypothetical protein